MSKVYIVLVNWNGWADTIECLESVFRNTYSNYRVIVCDNGSEDNSIECIKSWADGRLNLIPHSGEKLFCKSSFPTRSPITYVEYSQKEAEAGGNDNDFDRQMIIIKNMKNLGFAGGNNVGLRYALARGDFGYVWLLNNDTVIEPDALENMVIRMRERPDAGICGSTLLYYDNPKRVQAMGGGYYCKWIGLPWHLGRLKKATDAIEAKKVESSMNYVIGASMLVSKEFLIEIGLMCEDYFLYFEETDWAIRSKGRYAMVYAPKSVVYHKVGSSIGTSSNPRKKSLICDYYNIRNRLFFTLQYYPYALPGIYLVILLTLLTRIVLGKWERVSMILNLLIHPKSDAPDKIMLSQRGQK